MSYCPECGYEYKEGITQCPDCGSKLIDSLPTDEYVDKKVKWVKVSTLPGHLYADMLKEVLDKENIPSIIRGSGLEPIMSRGTEGNPVTMMVPEQFRERCVQIHRELFGNL